MLQYQTQPGKTGDGSGKKGDEVAFADGWLLGTLLNEGLVTRVAFEFGAVAGFGERVVFDVGFISVSPYQRSYQRNINPDVLT